MAEQDRLDQIGGQGAAVHGHKGLAGAVRGAVQGPRDDFLADTAFAGDQDGNVGLGGSRAHALDQLHGRARSDQVIEGHTARGMFLQA